MKYVHDVVYQFMFEKDKFHRQLVKMFYGQSNFMSKYYFHSFN